MAAVLICALLLFGVSPHAVFLSGHAVMSALRGFGFDVPKPVGVVTTFVVWWAIIVLVWLALQRLRRG